MENAEFNPSQFSATGDHFARSGALRPPWSTESRIKSGCTSCGACIQSCPEDILFAGPANTPAVDFLRGACTFCQACAEACDEGVFDPTAPPWHLRAALQTNCLLQNGVSCRSCTDACETRALTFDLRSGPVGKIDVDVNSCTGCGACLTMCPVSAITLKTQRLQQKASK